MSEINFQGVTIIGLGPGDPALMTIQGRDWLSTQAEVFTLTPEHPALVGLPAGVRVIPVMDASTEPGRPGSVTPSQVLDLAMRPHGVTYAAPGNPLQANSAALAFYREVISRGLPVRLLPGLGHADYAASLVGNEITSSLCVVAASEIADKHVPPQAGTVPLLVTSIQSKSQVEKIIACLLAIYPPAYQAKLILPGASATSQVASTTLKDLAGMAISWPESLLFIPPMEPGSSFEDFQEVIARLRAPDGCPWDREQTHLSLRRHLLEETYEALEALDAQNPARMTEEFGDLLLQIVLHAQIASEAGEFNMVDIVRGIHHKIIQRHPHVFGELEVGGVQGVLQNWEKLKAAERAAKGEETKGLLDGVPPALPALTQAQEIQERAARVGFDWPEIDGVLAKVGEEIHELHSAESEDELAWELGDLLFAVVNVSRWKKVDAETALRDASKRFRQRFAYIERAARGQGRSVADLSFEEMDRLWDAAKGKRHS